MTAADAAAAAAAQIERLTIAGARYAGMGLRAAHLVSLGCAVHDTMQVAPAYAPIHTPKTFSLPNLQWTVGCPLPALPGPAAPPRTDTVTRTSSTFRSMAAPFGNPHNATGYAMLRAYEPPTAHCFPCRKRTGAPCNGILTCASICVRAGGRADVRAHRACTLRAGRMCWAPRPAPTPQRRSSGSGRWLPPPFPPHCTLSMSSC